MKKIVLLSLLFVICLMNHSLSAATTHKFGEGDTLWDLAAKYYGDPTLYPILLEVNGIDNPRTILNGTIIIIPNKDDMKAIANETDNDRKKALLVKVGAKTGGGRATDKPKKEQGPADEASRTGEVDPNETSFTNILKGPKVAPEKLIKTNVP